jgi:lysozyme
MMFNMGLTRLSKFKNHNAALQSGDWKEAAKEGRDSKWHKQVTNRAERLMKRLEEIK